MNALTSSLPFSSSTFPKKKYQRMKRMIRLMIPARLLLVSKVTVPIKKGPMIAANFPSMLKNPKN